MYAIKDNAIVQVHAKTLIRIGDITDSRIDQVEQMVALHFDVAVNDLKTYYHDTEAKLMCCFVLHDALQYSVSSIAKSYNIYPSFLQKNITEHYHRCLLDEAFFELVKGFENVFLYNKTKLSQAIN